MPLIPPGTRKGNRHYIWRATVNGRLVEKSTKTANRREAQRRVRALRAETLRVTDDKPPRGVPETFADAADRYLQARDPSTNDRRFVEALKGEIGTFQLDAVTPSDIHTAAHTLYPGRSNATKNRNAVVPGAAVLHYAAENDWCPWRRVKKLKEAEPEPRRVEQKDIERLILVADDDMRKLLVFLYMQGWRLSEALYLKRSHVDFEDGTLLAYISKSRKWKRVLMDPTVAKVLKEGEWWGPEHRAFPWETRWQVYRQLRPLCKSLSIKFTPHMARHAFASEMDEAGASARDMTKLGTWTNEKSVLRYQHPNREYLERLLKVRSGERRDSA